MGSQEFRNQYKTPDWQKKRLEALEHAEFKCQCCFDGESQLHVHHRQYFKGRKVWEYGVNELEVLCESCHEYAHEKLDKFKAIQSRIASDVLLEISSLVAGYMTEIRGPMSAIKISDVTSEFENGRSYLIGVLAGAIENVLPTGESILAATNQVRDFYQENDGDLQITINKQRNWWDKE